MDFVNQIIENVQQERNSLSSGHQEITAVFFENMTQIDPDNEKNSTFSNFYRLYAIFVQFLEVFMEKNA